MLRVTYEAVDDLEPGRLATITEHRGEVLIRLDTTQPLTRVVRKLNKEMAQFLSRADWFQLWGDEITSRHNPGAPLRVEYVLLPGAPAGAGIVESRGEVRYYVEPTQTVDEFAAATTKAVEGLLDGGCWFQLYAGEIIDHSPEPMKRV